MGLAGEAGVLTACDVSFIFVPKHKENSTNKKGEGTAYRPGRK